MDLPKAIELDGEFEAILETTAYTHMLAIVWNGTILMLVLCGLNFAFQIMTLLGDLMMTEDDEG